ncbi:MAG: tetratricopeptide repeat protein, partial [Candidatus Omnitrophota bacterium]
AIKADSKFIKAYCEIAVAYMEKGDFSSAINNLKRAIELDAKYPKAEYAIAVSYARKTPPDVKKAREHFENSKKLGYRAPEWFERFLSSLEKQ